MRKTIHISLLIALLWNSGASATKIADITRIAGQRTNVLTGMGLVIGLRGTGDGGDFAPAINPLASMLGKFANPTTARELANVSNVAIVSITATVPQNGVRDGDRISVYVTSLGAASSLRGGRCRLGGGRCLGFKRCGERAEQHRQALGHHARHHANHAIDRGL